MRAEAAPSFLLLPELAEAGARLTLPEPEAHYLTRVCRARPGDRVSATDGRGARATVRLLADDRPAAVEVESCDRRPRTRTAWMLAGPPEGERGDWLVEKLGELGVDVFQPVDCERAAWAARRERTERWRRLAVAALRQSRRRFLLEIRPPRPLEDLLRDLPPTPARWVADPAGGPASGVVAPPEGLAIGLIGPSAGLAPRELELVLEAGFSRMALSDSRLRTETAAMAWACWWGAAVARPTPQARSGDP